MFVTRTFRGDLDCASTAMAVICKPGVSAKTELHLASADLHAASDKLQRPTVVVRHDKVVG